MLVSKWSYGCGQLTLPFCPLDFGRRLLFRPPARGDLVVFKLPRDGHTDYIKRVIGLPGDRVQLRAGLIYVNGRPVARRALGEGQGDLTYGLGPVLRYQEAPPSGASYTVQLSPAGGPAENTPVYAVPAHCYFTLGDNRDNSLDSRFDPALSSAGSPQCGWDPALDQNLPPEAGIGFVPEQNLVGKAELVLFSWSRAGFRRGRFGVRVH